ncbi:MAG: DNA helicase UvrBC, partial [Planctomycetaceae bacterium]|nr:DNA helicase UvrBC [Planctomycetaceae bacterium]
MKKCKVCNKPAVYHLTEIQNGQAQALHFCEDHFQEYISGQAPQDEWEPQDEATLIELNSQDLELDEELECPNCGITFQEFRSEGRLGCPHDYIAFREPLIQLL